MATDLIRYDLHYQDAMRGIVRKVLADVARDGVLPGDHHFFINFRTHAPGVRLSAKMRKQYPETMTIVLQHQFWGLSVGEQAFEVGLSFNGEAETLQIPFDAVVGFFDPSVDFALKIMQEAQVQADAEPQGAKRAPAKLAEPEGRTLPVPEKTKPRGSGSEPTTVDPTRKLDERPPAEVKPSNEAAETKVVSIETFRKKP
jgi:uncharacterized protein